MSIDHFQIRDPIHGVIFISKEERAVIDSMAFQRLRNIKQVGFLDFAFPSATHSRYSHSLGAMHMASRMFEMVMPKKKFSHQRQWERMRQTVRLAALLHDIGHPPLSHTTEMIMPKASALGFFEHPSQNATHEHYTRKIILDSDLTGVLKKHYSSHDISPQMVEGLLSPTSKITAFLWQGQDYGPLLRQIISSEIDADRMDYLLRDSFSCGVNYGKFDKEWLINNLASVNQENIRYLALKERAIFAFEDFLLSRYHMFASVYLHHTPVIMEKMLELFFMECPGIFKLPTCVENYLKLWDMDLWQTLRNSENHWAQRIVQRKPYRLLMEKYLGRPRDLLNTDFTKKAYQVLRDEKISAIVSCSKSVLSTYFGKTKHPLFVIGPAGEAVLLEDYSSLFGRYRKPAEISRIFVREDQLIRAQEILQKLK